MAAKKMDIKTTRKGAPEKQAPPKKKKKLWKKLLIVFLLIIILAGGFLAGIYLRLFNTKELNAIFHFYDWPVIGTHFKKPDDSSDKKKVIKVDVSGKQSDSNTPGTGDGSVDGTKNANKANQPPADPQQLLLSKQKIEAEQKAERAAANNRISQLAQMFAQMDPQKAATILSQLNSNMTASILQQMDSRNAAQIVSALPAGKGAQIAQTLYNGVTPPTIGDINSAAAAAGQQNAAQ